MRTSCRQDGPLTVVSSTPAMVVFSTSDVRRPDGLSPEWLTSLDGLQPVWNELARASPTAHPQYLFDWLEPWWRHIGSRRHMLRCVRVCDTERTVAIAPLMLVGRRVHRLVTLRVLQWLGTGPSDQLDILSTGDHRAAGAAVAEHLARHKAQWDELHLQCVPHGSVAAQALIETLRTRLHCLISVKSAPAYYIDTGCGDWERYLETTSKKFVRRDLPRIRRRLAELGSLKVERDRDPDVHELMRIMVATHGARQEELGRESVFSDSASRIFLTEALMRLRRQGLLTVWTLSVGSDIGGYLVGFETGGVFYAWNMAHNPAYNSASPGKALWASAIQGCLEDETIHEFNMMRGDTDYKLKWTDTSRELLDIRVRNLSTPRSALLNRLRRSAG